MKVAIDSGPLVSGHKVRGIGVHTKELIEAMRHLRNGAVRVDALDFSINHQPLITNHYDIVHYPYFHPFFITLPFRKPAKKVVVTIHDLIPLIYPEHYPAGVKGRIRFLVQKFLLKNVDAIITISETSKRDICRFLGVQPNKVHVVYLAPREIFKRITNTSLLYSIEVKYKLPKKFVLYVGDVNYNKNIPNLIKACEVAKMPLVIAGKQAKEVENQNFSHPELVHLRGENFSRTVRLGYVPDEDLLAIYNLATVYCQPSFYEGFGLPVLEALACGCPVVASKTQALMEIAEGAATFVNPHRPEAIAEGFKHLIKNPRLPREYSWEKTAEETLATYKEVYEGR